VRLSGGGDQVAPILIIGIGNPSRGDDAIGPTAIERLEALAPPGVELLTDFQLQVEYALDLVGRQQVIFIDASVSAEPPFTFEPVQPAADESATSHALSPAAVLDTYRRITGAPLPSCWVLAVRGYAFELGEPLSPEAEGNLQAAMDALIGRLSALGSGEVHHGRHGEH